jgi:hypothetical protein
MKVKCIKQYKHFENVLDLGDEVELEIIRYDKDTVICNEDFPINRGKFTEAKFFETIAPAGTYKGYHFLAKDGKWYDDRCIANAIGEVPLSEIFLKVNFQ